MKSTKMFVLTMVFLFVVTPRASKVASAEVTVPEGFTVDVYAENVPMPLGLSFDSEGNLYVGHDDVFAGRIHKIAPGGLTVTPFGPTLYDPDSVAVDSSDHVLVGTHYGVYRVAPDGTSKLLTSTYMSNNTCLVIDHTGLFGQIGDVFVGNARSYYDIVRVKSDGTAYEFVSSSALHIPFGLAFDDVGYLYAAEISIEQQDVRGVYRIATDGEVSYFVGLNTPFSLVFDEKKSVLYVGDISDNVIYEVSLDGTVSIFAENISAWGLTFGPDGSLYVSDRSASPHRILKISRFVSSIPIDLAPDVFEVEVDPDQESEEPEEELISAFIELPAYVNVADVNVATVTLSLNGTILATAESPIIVGNILDVIFRLDLANVGAILGLEVTEVDANDEKIVVKATTAPTQPIDLVELTVSGDFVDGGSFTGTDAVRVMLEEDYDDDDDDG